MEIRLKINSDLIGASASTLCTIHCLATPFLFLASTCSKSCCSGAPSWWLWLDYGFLIISFFAVYSSTKSTAKLWSRRVSNPRPNKEQLRFLHVYFVIGFRNKSEHKHPNLSLFS